MRKGPGDPGRFISPGRVGALLLVVAAVWIGSGFFSRAVVAYRLNAEVHALERQNQLLADSNRAAEEQLAALARPGGAEEQARLHNYFKPDEKIYVVATPSPSPTATPAHPGAHPPDSPSHPLGGQSPGPLQQVWSAIASAFHR